MTPTSPDTLAAWVTDARRRTLALLEDLTEDRLLGPRLDIVNPPLWELGHVAWFQEWWVLRQGGERRSARRDADLLYDSARVPHATRWSLPLPSLKETRAWLVEVLERTLEAIPRADPYFVLLSVFHEDMHGEAFLYSRQTLGWNPPEFLGPPVAQRRVEPAAGGDARIPGGTFRLGAARRTPFVFDNEKWEHPVTLPAFELALEPVTQAQFAGFVEDGGYLRRELWSEAGWRWRESARATQPVHWRKEGNHWVRRDFEREVELEPHLPVVHVCWFEADAWCRWAGRRLPTEAEWEAAAAADPDRPGEKRRFPWGEAPPDPTRANLDGRARGCLDVRSLRAGDSAHGCRQLIGNVWEWTSSDFMPYPGFVVDPYEEYSRPWFGTHMVLRGGCFATRGRLLRNTWRNFYTPDRRDVFAGFRTCRVAEAGGR